MRFSEVRLTGGSTAPGDARRAVEERFGGRLPTQALADAGLLVSELVTNSVMHAGATEHRTIGLRLGLEDRRVRVEVLDPGPGFDPDRLSRDPDDPGGYGLFLVTQLADSWGVHPNDPTKVWFEIEDRATA